MREFDHSLAIRRLPRRVLDAFFDDDDLAAWWHVTRSLCHPRPLGSYAIEWAPTESRDDVLGRLGGAFHGTVIDFKPGREFFVADAYWLPPDGEPIGPMALEVTCTTLGERVDAPARRGSQARTEQPALDALLRHCWRPSNADGVARTTLKTAPRRQRPVVVVTSRAFSRT